MLEVSQCCMMLFLVPLTIILCLLWWLKRPNGLPPGPYLRLPLLGHMPMLKGSVLDNFQRLRYKYGDIFHLYFGPRLAVILNGYDVIQDALVRHADDFSDRPSFRGLEEFEMHKGIVTSSGEVWREHRKFALGALKEFGFGRNILQQKITEEVNHFISALKEERGQAFDLSKLLHNAVSNIICNIVFGNRFQYTDAKFQEYLRCIEANFRSGGIRGFLRGTFLRKLPGDVTGYKAALRNINLLRYDLVEPSMKEHLENYQPDCISDFIDAYIKEMKDKASQEEPTYIRGDYLWRVVSDLFLAGTESTTTTIRWALVYLLNYPDIQNRLCCEMQEKIGSGRQPTLEDRSQLPFLDAFILEVQRHANVTPLAVPHGVSHNVSFRGFIIPKDSIVMINLDSILRDSQLWKDADQFRPERFLKEGKVVKPDEFVPFSLGRRKCLGESLAKMELFLFISALIQHFQFECVENQVPSDVKRNLGFVHIPDSFQIRAIPRK